MALSKQAAKALMSMGEQLGLAWQSNTRKTRGTDAVLNICIGDGLAPTKIDGWIHACMLIAKSMLKYANDPDRVLDIVSTTSWVGGNSALRYARRQVDFHWKIDTRRHKLSQIADRLHIKVVHAPRAIEYQANLKPFNAKLVSVVEIENNLIRLCRELPPVMAAVDCPPAMMAN